MITHDEHSAAPEEETVRGLEPRRSALQEYLCVYHRKAAMHSARYWEMLHRDTPAQNSASAGQVMNLRTNEYGVDWRRIIANVYEPSCGPKAGNSSSPDIAEPSADDA